MSSRGKSFLQQWAVTTLGVVIAANVVDGIRYDTFLDLVLASLLLGILNAFVRPILVILALPLLVFTLGLFILVINGVLLYWVGGLLNHFHVDGFWSSFLGALVISVVSMIANWLFGPSETRVQVRRRTSRAPRPPDRQPPPDGKGPIIDV